MILAERLFLFAAWELLVFLVVQGERFRLHVQRGWQVIITALALLFIGRGNANLDSYTLEAPPELKLDIGLDEDNDTAWSRCVAMGIGDQLNLSIAPSIFC